MKISGRRILVTSLAGSLNVLKRVGRGIFIVERYTSFLIRPKVTFTIFRFFPGSMELGEIYSLACDTNHIITGHTLTNSAFKIWSADNFDTVKIIREESNESIIWNIHLKYPLALICRYCQCSLDYWQDWAYFCFLSGTMSVLICTTWRLQSVSKV